MPTSKKRPKKVKIPAPKPRPVGRAKATQELLDTIENANKSLGPRDMPKE